MKKFLAALCLTAIFPVFAEVMPVSYEDESVQTDEYVEDPTVQDVPETYVQPVVPAVSTTRSVQNLRAINRQTATAQSRAVSARTATTAQAVTRSESVTRPVSSRTAAMQSRGASGAARATTRSRTLATTITGGDMVTTRVDSTQKAVQARATTSSGTLYIPTNTARVGVTTATVGSTTRGIASRASTLSTSVPTLFTSGDTTTTSASDAETLAAQTDFCKAQYLSCMDNFCNVLDDNQGRCSCSSNVTKYERVEDALKKATTDLQDIATKIRYLGLSKDDVKSLFSQTAAEEEMQSSSDSSAIKNSLDNIQKLLLDPKSQTTTSGSLISTDFTNLDFGSGFDLNSFINADSSITSQRGAALFDTAKARCASVLTDCRKQNVDTTLVTANYDLEIDKQCVSYERALTDANDQMTLNIKNATTVLQQARLMVAQNKNKYDLKGCVSALDSCMQDEFVCGSDYENCLDTNGQFIVNGEVLAGSTPTDAAVRDANWKYGTKCAFDASAPTVCNPSTNGSVMEMVNEYSASTDNNLVKLLMSKIGTITSDGVAIGMCSGILNQCQTYTYNGNTANMSLAEGTGNQALTQYLVRTLTKIKAQQDTVFANYGSSCTQSLISCFTQNGASSSGTTVAGGLTTTISTCSPYIKTCGSVLGITTFDQSVSSYVCPTATPYLSVSTIACSATP